MRAIIFVGILVLSFSITAQEAEWDTNYYLGRWDENIDRINRLLTSDSVRLRPAVAVRLLLQKAKQYWAKTSHQNFSPDSARAILDQAMNRGEGLALREELSDALHLRGQLAFREAFQTGDFKPARMLFRQALTLRSAIADSQRLSQSLFYLALTYEQSDALDSAEIFHRRAYDLAVRHHWAVERSDPERHLGGLALTANRLDEARKWFAASLQSRRQAKLFIGIPYALITLADQWVAEAPTLADSLYREAASVAEQHNVWRALVNALNALGSLHQVDCDKAQSFFNRAREMARTFDYSSGEKKAAAGLAACMK